MQSKFLLFLFLFTSINITFAQKKIKKEPAPLQYPFDITGTKNPRGVFGTDDRKEVKDADGISDFVRATAVMIPKSSIYQNKVYGRTLRDRLKTQYGSSNFDDNVKFLDQPTVAHCTGFLIAPDILVTAGHCIEKLEDADKYVWVFDYTNEISFNSSIGFVSINPNNVYEVAEVLDAYFKDLSTYTDYSVLRLNRSSTRDPYRFRTSGTVSDWDYVNTIGSPTGLPLKYADNSYVVDNSPEKWFKNSIDGFPGNSGGPVFNKNGFIEGIHVRGAVELQDGRYTGDYKYDKSCDCIKTVQWSSTLGTAGSHAHRITEIPHNLLHKAIYENIEYAIKHNLKNRLNSWIAYSWLLDHEYTNKRGRLELVAARLNNLYALSSILERTETVTKDWKGRNLLYYAIKHNNQQMLEYLLDYGISPSEKDNDSKTALNYAINNRDLDAAETLIDYGANVFEVDAKGNNLVHTAVRIGNMSLIRKLVNKGISLNAKNNNGLRPDKLAKKLKLKSAYKYLKKARKRR